MPPPTARSAGILLHPTSLPGPYGIGDLGPGAYSWIDSLAHAGQKWWQILPLGPTSYGDSPYQSFSAFAGNPLLVSPQFLLQDGLLAEGDLAGAKFPNDKVDFGPVIEYKNRLLSIAWDHFQNGWAQTLRPAFEQFQHQHAAWLEDFGLFMGLKDAHDGKSWHEWETPLRMRDSAALKQYSGLLEPRIGLHTFRQFLFFRQWDNVKRYAHERKIKIIGDIPIFVASDSADVWASPQFFELDKHRNPRVVAGVPPDYFSATGQLWGNPLYDWKALKADKYRWWVARLRSCISLVDLVRLDHFRGFEAYWEIPAGMPNAIKGQWVKGPGVDLLETLLRELGNLPLIAEDLGVITPEVEMMRDKFALPGMRIIQFSFDGGPENPYLPHNYVARTVAYTGTHDNDTTRGWYASAPEREKDFARRYLARDGSDISWDLIRLAWASVADYAIAPLQDLLDLGNEARMNLPGRLGNNWGWRFLPTQLSPGVLDRLGAMTALFGR